MQSCGGGNQQYEQGLLRAVLKAKGGKEVEMVGRLHTDICNVPTHLPPGVRMQIKLTKAKREI